MIGLLANKLLLACSVGVAVVSVISLPATFALTSNKGANEVFQPLLNAVETATDQGKSHFSTLDQNLSGKYKDFGKQVITNAQEAPKAVGAKLQSMSKSAGAAAKLVNEKKEEGNYYAFQLGELIKALLKHLPSIAKESLIEAYAGENHQYHLLSAQKIYNIAASEKFGEFLNAMSKVVSQHRNLFANLSNEDNNGIIQIFKELQNNEQEIEKFLEKVKENTSNLSTETYECATKLMMHVLIGKTHMDEMETIVTNLTNTLDKLKSQINSILNSNGENQGITADSLTQKLNEIKNNLNHIKNPCSKAAK